MPKITDSLPCVPRIFCCWGLKMGSRLSQKCKWRHFCLLQGAERYEAEREAIDHYLNTHDFADDITILKTYKKTENVGVEAKIMIDKTFQTFILIT